MDFSGNCRNPARRPYRRHRRTSRAAFAGGFADCECRPIEVIIPSPCKVEPHGENIQKRRAMLTHEPDLDRAGPAGRARRTVAVGAGQTIRARSHHLQQVQAHHPDGRERWPSTESVAKALAATNTLDRHVRAADRRRRADRAVGAAARPRASGQRRPFRRSAVIPPARAGTRWPCPPSTTSTPMRWKFPATR